MSKTDRPSPKLEVETGTAGSPVRAGSSLDVCVVVTVTERPASLIEFYEEYARVLRERGISHQFIFVADAKYVHLLDDLEELGEGEGPRLIRVGQSVGEAALIGRALQVNRADVLLTLPAYHRVEPDALPDLVAAIHQGADVAVARRYPREDSWVNRLQTRAFHAVLHRIASDRVDDVACGVRAMRREVLESVPLYGDFFRFFPLFAAREGYHVVQVDTPQHPGDQETRIYRPGVYVRRLIDLLAVFFLLRFTWKPLRFFGLVGSALAGTGGLVLLILLVQRVGGQGIADRPLLLLGVLLLVLGVQAVALGLIGEIIVHLHAPSRSRYRATEHTDEEASSEAETASLEGFGS